VKHPILGLRTMPTRTYMSLRAALTAPAVRYPPDPRALFLLILLVIVGVPLIFANATPGTIASQLDAPWVVAWGVMLSGGSALSLLGAVRQTVNGVIAEQVGSVALGFACLIYSGAIWSKVEWAGSVPMGILFALGTASIARYFQLRAYLRNVEQQAQEIRNIESLDDE
jgi:hypothetical protein